MPAVDNFRACGQLRLDPCELSVLCRNVESGVPFWEDARRGVVGSEAGVDSHKRRRYDVVSCSVVGHARYGLLIESEDGEQGYVGSGEISDKPGEPWPPVGERLRCVVLGYAKGDRLRGAATPSYVAKIATAEDPAAAADEWMVWRKQQYDKWVR